MKILQLPTEKEALPGRSTPMFITTPHTVLNTSLQPPFPVAMQKAMFGMGCFWGAEKKFWQLQGVYVTAVGYAAGITPNPNYEEVCSGLTGHNEVVLVVFDPAIITFETLLRVFWQGHNPTLGMRQGNDLGTQYRSGIYCFDKKQQELAEKSLLQYQKVLDFSGCNRITTEIVPAPVFYYAESYHQQYLAKNPSGYCPDITCHATGLPTFPS
jgi:peptide-methionine (S)-S-oxide reductase